MKTKNKKFEWEHSRYGYSQSMKLSYMAIGAGKELSGDKYFAFDGFGRVGGFKTIDEAKNYAFSSCVTKLATTARELSESVSPIAEALK